MFGLRVEEFNLVALHLLQNPVVATVSGVFAANVQDGRERQPWQVFGQGLKGGQIVAMRRGEFHQVGQRVAAHGGGIIRADLMGSGTTAFLFQYIGQRIVAATQQRLFGGGQTGDALDPMRGIGPMPPIGAFEQGGEEDAGFFQVVLLDLEQAQTLPGLAEQHLRPFGVLSLVFGDEFGENGLGLRVPPVVGGIAAHVQVRLRRPGAVGEILDVLAEHFDGLGVFVLVPFLDRFAEIEMSGFGAPFVLQFAGWKERTTQLARRAQFLRAGRARKVKPLDRNPRPAVKRGHTGRPIGRRRWLALGRVRQPNHHHDESHTGQDAQSFILLQAPATPTPLRLSFSRLHTYPS